MCDILLVSVGLIVTGAALFGFGKTLRGFLKLPAGSWPATIILGLAAWIFMGGVLNCLGLAYPIVEYGVLAGGLCVTLKFLFGVDLSKFRMVVPAQKKDELLYLLVWGITVITIALVTIITQSSPSAYNYHDDYQKHFSHVAREIQTGSLRGSPLNTLGSETLGGQAFLQSLPVSISSFSYINTADAVFCFILLVLMIGGIALERPPIRLIAILSIIAVWTIDCQYVSVTALFSAAALLFGLLIFSLDRREFSLTPACPPPAAIRGLFFAAIVALKMTFVIFISVYFILDLVFAFALERKPREVVRHAAATLAWSALFIMPWILIYLPLYYGALTNPAAALVQAPTPQIESISLFSTQTLVYGGFYAVYTFVAAMPCLLSLGLLFLKSRLLSRTGRFLSVCCSLMAAYLLMLLIFGPLLAGYETALRYYIPVLIGVIPAFLIYWQWNGETENKRFAATGGVVSTLFAISLIVGFFPDAIARAKLVIRTGTMLAYLNSWTSPAIEPLLSFTKDALKGGLPLRIKEQQDLVPEGQSLVAWTSAPFLLDFVRNPIVDIDIGGLLTPWARTPPSSYILWQYKGFGVRTPGTYQKQANGPGRRETYLAAEAYAYCEELQKMAANVILKFNDGQTALMELPPGLALP